MGKHLSKNDVNITIIRVCLAYVILNCVSKNAPVGVLSVSFTSSSLFLSSLCCPLLASQYSCAPVLCRSRCPFIDMMMVSGLQVLVGLTLRPPAAHTRSCFSVFVRTQAVMHSPHLQHHDSTSENAWRCRYSHRSCASKRTWVRICTWAKNCSYSNPNLFKSN